MTTQTKYRKYDSESDYYAMGYRMYSAEFGRFLAVDPLYEAMPRHNPYHYSFNSPMFWSDPSGLVPVKNKVKNSEKLLMLQLDTRIFEEAYDGIMEENGRAYARMSRTYSYDLNNLRTNGNYFTWNIWNAFNVFDLYMGSGGGSGGSVAENSEESRSGEQAAGENGTEQKNNELDKDKKTEITSNIDQEDENLFVSILGIFVEIYQAIPKSIVQFLFLQGDTESERHFSKNEDAISHFEKHGDDIRKVLGYKDNESYTLDQYLSDANWIIKNGHYHQERNGYYYYFGVNKKGESLFGFVGMKPVNKISTFHIKTAKQLGLK